MLDIVDCFGIPLKHRDLIVDADGGLWRVFGQHRDNFDDPPKIIVSSNGAGSRGEPVKTLDSSRVVNYNVYNMHKTTFGHRSLGRVPYQKFGDGDIVLYPDLKLHTVRNGEYVPVSVTLGYFFPFTEQHRWNLENYPELFI